MKRPERFMEFLLHLITVVHFLKYVLVSNYFWSFHIYIYIFFLSVCFVVLFLVILLSHYWIATLNFLVFSSLLSFIYEEIEICYLTVNCISQRIYSRREQKKWRCHSFHCHYATSLNHIEAT